MISSATSDTGSAKRKRYMLISVPIYFVLSKYREKFKLECMNSVKSFKYLITYLLLESSL
jgi:hypothetical protein